ncbi:MAG: heme exporter protein CcmB [Cytophagales bacterium]
MKELLALYFKDLQLDFKNKSSVSSVLLYTASIVFVAYYSFKVKIAEVGPIVWNALFWVITLFISINASGKSFQHENNGVDFYLYQLSSPLKILFSKILYNITLLLITGILSLMIYSIIMGNPVGSFSDFFIIYILGIIGFGSILTMIAGIAFKVGNNFTLMAIMSLPLLLPLEMLLIKGSMLAIDDLGWGNIGFQNIVYSLISLIMIEISLSYLLFPYLWRA